VGLALGIALPILLLIILLVTLASSLEKEFGLTFDVDDLMEMENVKEICRIVQSKLGKVGNAQLS